MKSVVVDSYEYEWQFSLCSFSVLWKHQCCSQTAKLVLTSSVGNVFYCMALLIQGRRLYAKPWQKFSHASKSSPHTHVELIEMNSHSLFSKSFSEVYTLQSWLNAHAALWGKQQPFCVISGFRDDVHEICDFRQRRVVIPYRRFGPTDWTHHQGSASSADASEPIVGDGTDRLSRKVGTVLPHKAA
jgi:hypothetical protein